VVSSSLFEVDVARKDGPQWSKIAKPFFLKEVKSQERTIRKMIFRRVWNEGERVPEKTVAAVAPPPPGVWGQHRHLERSFSVTVH